MALLPYFFDDLRPRTISAIRDPILDLDLADDLLGDVLPIVRTRRYMRPWRNLSAIAKDIGSTIKSDKDKFQVNLDVQHFAPEEISVKIADDGYVVIEGKHEEKKDEHGYISRQFTRRYALPEECNLEMVESKLSSDGVLTITAPKVSSGKGERVIPITHTGPVRRKAVEDQQNGEAEHQELEEKTPQKKRRR